MNCKPGDLAATTGMLNPENNDVIVEVMSVSTVTEKGAFWNVLLRTPALVEYGPLVGTYSVRVVVADANLRPISGVPVHDEQLDEVTA